MTQGPSRLRDAWAASAVGSEGLGSRPGRCSGIRPVTPPRKVSTQNALQVSYQACGHRTRGPSSRRGERLSELRVRTGAGPPPPPASVARVGSGAARARTWWGVGAGLPRGGAPEGLPPVWTLRQPGVPTGAPGHKANQLGRARIEVTRKPVTRGLWEDLKGRRSGIGQCHRC